uniref:THAP-type domain-containing protein n=1 Tax=Erpetoichthys calabaricus TaxID=27687 RepID=A0A8C4REM2_ERPCA
MSEKKFKFQHTDSSTVEHCCVPLCRASSKYNKVLSFHTFPSDVKTQFKWILAIQSKSFTVSPRSETGRQLLKKGAVHILFEWNNALDTSF